MLINLKLMILDIAILQVLNKKIFAEVACLNTRN